MAFISEKKQWVTQLFQQMIHSNSQDKEAWNDLGLVFYNLNEYQNAIKCYRNSLREESNNVAVWYKIGKIFFNLREYQKAIDCFKRVVVTHPHLISVWEKILTLYAEINDFRKVKEINEIINTLRADLNQSIEHILDKILKSACGIQQVIFTDVTGYFLSYKSKYNIPSLHIYNEIAANMTSLF